MVDCSRNLVVPRLLMLMEALGSASNEKPQARQHNSAWLGRFFLSMCPQAEHCWLV